MFRLAADDGLRGLVSFCDPMPRRRQVRRTDGEGAARVVEETITPGHVGIIYQATGALALGRSTARTLTYLPRHGLVLPARTLQKVRADEPGAEGAERRLVALGARPRRAGELRRNWLVTALTDLRAERIKHPGNYRYAWPLGDRAQRRRAQIGMPSIRYPEPAGGRAAEQPSLFMTL